MIAYPQTIIQVQGLRRISAGLLAINIIWVF